MEEHAPIDPLEAKFLNHDQDLVLPGARARPTSFKTATTTTDLKQLMAFHCLMTIILLIAFSMMPGFLTKLLFGAMVCCLGAVAWVSQDLSIARGKKYA
jgi:hypothetical protein